MRVSATGTVSLLIDNPTTHLNEIEMPPMRKKRDDVFQREFRHVIEKFVDCKENVVTVAYLTSNGGSDFTTTPTTPASIYQ